MSDFNVLIVADEIVYSTLASYVLESTGGKDYKFFTHAHNNIVNNNTWSTATLLKSLLSVKQIITKNNIRVVCFSQFCHSLWFNNFIVDSLRRDFPNLTYISGGRWSLKNDSYKHYDYTLYGLIALESFRILLNNIFNKKDDRVGEVILPDGSKDEWEPQINPKWLNKQYKHPSVDIKYSVFDTYTGRNCNKGCAYCEWKLKKLASYTKEMREEDFCNNINYGKLEFIEFGCPTIYDIDCDLVSKTKGSALNKKLVITAPLDDRYDENCLKTLVSVMNDSNYCFQGSFGIQSLNKESLQLIKRTVVNFDNIAKQIKYFNNNFVKKPILEFDLIYGLPNEDLTSYVNGIKTSINRINCQPKLFRLTVMKTMKYKHDNLFFSLGNEVISTQQMLSFVTYETSILQKIKKLHLSKEKAIELYLGM